MTTSISEIRKDFPLLMSNDVIYLDTAATSQKPSCVLARIIRAGRGGNRKIRRSQRDGPGVFKCQRGGGDRFRPQCHGRLESGGLQFRLTGTETGR